ncbi:SRPBCC family protein [Desulfuromonas acetoxidans]|uniref:Ribosome association toxin RatA n=1 Tax=Desulfuromonas acetoxidans (strain DSM 684 / 11070) TaxID=281689 RepID=Q1JW94_DESA6|nr:SRPBCC family protein [Desulfuromonas acetoxidans]EAT14527.1 conserved hypothetical protein [Desulfuromonas acetoxidans DSM 684]MBF0645256.1 SRPBCC family protein [Desulfuromonas acetoxidans]NVD25562.1 SRPBCC family protein [Desulfuromonas acetoxidans]NVE17628.1 SRPBCC family protein [Desulfuromonas acetoxidans]
MKTYILKRQQNLPLTIEACWHFFSNPQNLPSITPDWLNLTMCSHPAESTYAGQLIEYRVTPLKNFSCHWLTEITHVEPPFFFVDEQRSGPYRFWHHQHHFEQAATGILMTDIVHYQLPFGIFGQWAQSLVAKKLQQIFDYRAQTLSRLFPGNDI